jgi:hypothetical protein
MAAYQHEPVRLACQLENPTYHQDNEGRGGSMRRAHSSTWFPVATCPMFSINALQGAI